MTNPSPEIPVDLSFDRTVSRTLVHRRSNAEVFLTDYRPLGAESFVCAAQLPRYHAYYNEGLAQSATYDPLLLLECCRQAATYGGHALFGNEANTTNLVTGIEIDITDPEALGHTNRPGELLMHAAVSHVTSKGRQKSGTMTVEMLLDGLHAGVTRIMVRVVPNSAFEALRRRQRGTWPRPSTDELPEALPGEPVLPERVGRQNPTNVLLTDATLEGQTVVTRVGVSSRNHSILDHGHDHLPAMALIEAGRQASLLVLDNGLGAGTVQPTGLSANFTKFAELDSPLLARATVNPAETLAGETTLNVDFRQRGNVIASANYTFPSVPTGSRETRAMRRP